MFRNGLREPTTTLHLGAQYPPRENTTRSCFFFETVRPGRLIYSKKVKKLKNIYNDENSGKLNK